MKKDNKNNHQNSKLNRNNKILNYKYEIAKVLQNWNYSPEMQENKTSKQRRKKEREREEGRIGRREKERKEGRKKKAYAFIWRAEKYDSVYQ